MTGESQNVLTPAIASSIIPLACSCGACHLPFATVREGGLWIQTIHNGEKHKNRVSDEMILQLAGMILLRQLLGVKA